MGRDREARMLAAGENFEVGKKKYKLRPMRAQHLCDLEREALRHYKDEYLRTFARNANLLGEVEAKAIIERKMDEVARWDLSNLPQKDAYDVSRCPITDEVKKWVVDVLGELPETDSVIKALLNTALDNGELTLKQVKEMSGKAPLHGKVRYDSWWITASIEGMVSLITSSICHDHPEVTSDVVAGWPFGKLAEAARIVERLTAPDLGNM